MQPPGYAQKTGQGAGQQFPGISVLTGAEIGITVKGATAGRSLVYINANASFVETPPGIAHLYLAVYNLTNWTEVSTMYYNLGSHRELHAQWVLFVPAGTWTVGMAAYDEAVLMSQDVNDYWNLVAIEMS
jgi:hypothetical protein